MKKKVRLKSVPKDTKKTYSIRFSPNEYAQAKLGADMYTGGDFSEWVRQAATRYIPAKEDLEKVS